MGHRTTKTNHKVKVHKTVSCRIDFFYYAFRNVLLVSIPLLVISGIVLSHLSLHSSAANSGSDNLAITISSSCTLSSVVNIPHNAEVYNGNHMGNIGKTTITTLCNDGNGYSVYAVGYSNNEEGNNKLINSERPEYSIDTGLATSGLTSAWAMKLNNIPDDPSPTPPTIETDYNNVYGIVPPYWTKVAERASGTTDMAQGSSFTTTYAVYASSSQYAGTYNGQVKYLLTHPSSDAKHFFMQNVAEWKDQMIPHEGDSIQAVDERDGKSYWVTRLADGNIWMTQNLDLDLSHLVALNSETSDINPNTYNTGIYTESTGYRRDTATGIVSWTPDNIANTLSTNWNSTTTATISSWANNYNRPYSADAGNKYKYTDYASNETTIYNSLSACNAATNDAEGCQHAHIGNYYNWTAAVATNNTSGYNSGTPANSLCPKNWSLPVNGEYGVMLQAQSIWSGSDKQYSTDGYLKIRTSPLYFVQAATIDSGSLNISSTVGSYWSSTVNGAYDTYILVFSSSHLNPAGYYFDYRNRGLPIRCMANNA